MKLLFIKILLFIPLLLVLGCQEKKKTGKRKVKVVEVDGKYQLYRDGKPYYIKGAGGSSNLKQLKENGGNSVRLWSSYNAKKVLDEAHKLGLTVTLGLDVGRERLGFDYDDEKAVAEQFKRIKKEVLKYKDHPALLMWGIGNEVDQLGSNMKCWDAVNDIAKMIHEVDPDHPTTTMIVPHRKKILYVKYKCPDIDILSINTFEEIPGLSDKLNEWIWGWDGPYLITEWGSTGWWECKRTSWDVGIEPTSTKKAGLLKNFYKHIEKDKKKCLGSYVFYWGAKQERTPTWFSMFLNSGHATEAVETMHFNWKGMFPENRSPKIRHFSLDNQSAEDNVFLSANKKYSAKVLSSDPDDDSLYYLWDIMPESTDLNGGGDWEKRPSSRYDLIKDLRSPNTTITSPKKEGPYRLFVYVYDDKKHVATANIPFYVMH